MSFYEKGPQKLTISNTSLYRCESWGLDRLLLWLKLCVWPSEITNMTDPFSQCTDSREETKCQYKCWSCDPSTGIVGKQRQFRGPENASYWYNPWAEPWRMRNSQVRKKLFGMERASSICKSLELERGGKALERSHFSMTARTELESWITKRIS